MRTPLPQQQVVDNIIKALCRAGGNYSTTDFRRLVASLLSLLGEESVTNELDSLYMAFVHSPLERFLRERPLDHNQVDAAIERRYILRMVLENVWHSNANRVIGQYHATLH